MLREGDGKSAGRGPSASGSAITLSFSGVNGPKFGVDGSASYSSSEVIGGGGELGGKLRAFLRRLGGGWKSGS